jgi:hypothetical protein
MTRQGPVLLVLEEEDRSAVVERLDALSGGLGIARLDAEALPLQFMVQQGVAVADAQGEPVPELVRHIQEVKPALIVLDPFRRVHDLEENDSRVMSRLFTGLRRLAAGTPPCSFLLVHHLKKASEHSGGTLDRLRGSTDIAASVDSLVEVTGELGNLRLRHAKSKRGPTQGEFLVLGECIDGTASLRFAEVEAKSSGQRGAVRAWVIRTLAGSELSLRGLAGAAKVDGYGRDRLETVLRELIEEHLVTVTDGHGRSHIHRLTEQGLALRGKMDATASPSAAEERSAEEPVGGE